MPSAAVHVSMTTALQRNGQTRWTRNHIVDRDAMCVAVFYGDIVVPDSEVHHLLNAANVPKRFGTQIPTNLMHFAELLDSQRPARR